MLAVYLRELKSYFYSAIGYVFMGVFLFVIGLFFTSYNISQGSSYYNNVLGSIVFIFLIIIPILTMKILSEEKKSKTDQLLLTSPLKLRDIVLGKYFAALSVFFISIIITVLYPFILSRFGTIAIPEIFCGYVGLFLLGAAFISIGMFMSSLTENQVVAAALTFGALLFFYILENIQQILPSSRSSGIAFAIILAVLIACAVYFTTKNIYASLGIGIIGVICIVIMYLVKNTIFDGFVVNFFGWFSLLQKYTTFSAGIMSLSSAVYLITFSALFIFFTIHKLEKRRWE